jgi:hypothetical protein
MELKLLQLAWILHKRESEGWELTGDVCLGVIDNVVPINVEFY